MIDRCAILTLYSKQLLKNIQIMNKKYIPNPADTSGVKLPEELLPLVEEMAKSVHEVWAQNRMNEGWTYGPVRDDAKKQHPCLVAYEELPDSEKEYDRATSQETLKLILKSGFSISKTAGTKSFSHLLPSTLLKCQ